MKIAFIGLGNMGAPMAHNLLKAGHALQVFDLNPAALRALQAAGAQVVASPRAAVAGVECVITMLPAAAHVRSVLCGEEGVLSAVAPGIPLIDCSTIDPASAQAFADMAGHQGNPFADAPVSGGTGGAAAGTLTFMVGAGAALFEQIRPLLGAMGKHIVHCGAVGMGQTAKICNNLVLGISMAAVAEAMALGDALGIDSKVLAGVINTSSGRCWSSETYNPFPGVVETAPAGRGYSGGFGTDLMLKDLGLATEAARSVHQPAYMGALAQQLYQALSQRGDGRLDFSAIIKLYQG
ncbi:MULTISPECIES: 3-hydroxyisobutyrate dehydrogenase [unclassified Paludibacterium]|uniref:3-hydroxyisobutyrate dehydrogenase n=1 Tax=unclassified Paludibacterium TaxID=2618429 RepID=UPI001C051238|nr:3-hydroxyisobutyrate dehydrogenase [Paludibacterium sp. B53371]BEV72695.1 3-hydroxyisobutyrate dehydrogenase [Paludibacterium sp. THUN1379]